MLFFSHENAPQLIRFLNIFFPNNVKRKQRIQFKIPLNVKHTNN